MRFVNDAVEFISGVHAAVPEIEFHNVGRQSVSPVLCASFPDRVDCELAVRLYPCPFGVSLEVPQELLTIYGFCHSFPAFLNLRHFF